MPCGWTALILVAAVVLRPAPSFGAAIRAQTPTTRSDTTSTTRTDETTTTKPATTTTKAGSPTTVRTVPPTTQPTTSTTKAGSPTTTSTALPTTTTAPPVPPLTVPTCYGSANLVQNPSLEMVDPAYLGPGVTDWSILDHEVPHWSKLPISSSPASLRLNGGSGTVNIAAFQGTKFVQMGDYAGPNGIVGDLVSPVVPWAPYTLTARVATGVPSQHFATFELRFRNSASGVESGAGSTASMNQSTPHWVLITATITPTAAYDEVVVRYAQGGDGIGLVDDVHVTCKNPGTSPWWKTWAWLGLALVAVTLFGGVVFWVRRRARAKRTATLLP
jgi:hypothetical protein